MLARTLAGELEREAVDPRDAVAREYRRLGRELLGQAAVHAAAAARILAFGILAHDHPVDRVAAFERARDSRQHARGAHVCVLVESLAYRQPQSPQRKVVG